MPEKEDNNKAKLSNDAVMHGIDAITREWRSAWGPVIVVPYLLSFIVAIHYYATTLGWRLVTVVVFIVSVGWTRLVWVSKRASTVLGDHTVPKFGLGMRSFSVVLSLLSLLAVAWCFVFLKPFRFDAVSTGWIGSRHALELVLTNTSDSPDDPGVITSVWILIRRQGPPYTSIAVSEYDLDLVVGLANSHVEGKVVPSDDKTSTRQPLTLPVSGTWVSHGPGMWDLGLMVPVREGIPPRTPSRMVFVLPDKCKLTAVSEGGMDEILGSDAARYLEGQPPNQTFRLAAFLESSGGLELHIKVLASGWRATAVYSGSVSFPRLN